MTSALSAATGSAGRMLADGDTDKGSPVGLFIVLVLIVAVYFLYRSMSRHINRVPESFPSQLAPTSLPAAQPEAGSEVPPERPAPVTPGEATPMNGEDHGG